MYDVIIVGAGAAGLSAGIYTVRAGKTALILEAAAYGGQIINTPDIENYPGIAHISGFDFATGLYNQAKELGAEVRFEKVERIREEGDRKRVITSQGEYEAKAVILATGAKNRELGLPREKELVGRGVSYCATCDGMFFRNKVVAVNGGGNTALEDAQVLAQFCERVYLIHRRDAFRGDEAEIERVKNKLNIELVLNARIAELLEDENGLCGLRLENTRSGEQSDLKVDGLFVAIGQEPDNRSFAENVELDEKGYIRAGEDLKTRSAGIFTAGDCRTKSVRQLITAAADGAIAAIAAVAYADSVA